ncbi:MAG: GH32 C-terminal domain-containing protein [Floccifex porci]|uniref:GH32 C-terminal domain-containing protein n=1 Tax=Floccifex porci TaxID=2606629 RepID=UPI003F006039
MIKKVLQGALSASMLLSGIVVYSPVIVNAQEQSSQTMQTQNVSNLESRIPQVVIENNGGDNFLRLATVQGQTNFTFSADVTFTDPNEEQSAALLYGIRSTDTNDSLKANVHGTYNEFNARVWGYATQQQGQNKAFFQENGIDLTKTFTMKVSVQNRHLVYKVNDIVICEQNLSEGYNGGEFGLMTFKSTAIFSNIIIEGESLRQGYASVEGTTIYGLPGGDAHTLLGGVDSVKAFTYEADVNLINGSCAALTFGIQDSNNPGASWLGANFNFNDYDGKGRIRVFSVNGASVGDNDIYKPILDIDKTKTIHMKLDVTEDGQVTFSVGNDESNTHKVETTLTKYIGGYLGALAFNSSASFSNIKVSIPSEEIPEVPAEPETPKYETKFINIGSAKMDIEGNDITLANSSGNHFAMLEREKANDFIWEADLAFTGNDTIKSAGLVFGVENKNNPGSKWYCANLDSQRMEANDFFRVFGTVIADAKMSDETKANMNIDITQPLHLKVEMKKNGEFTYSFSNAGSSSVSTIIGTISNWEGGYVGLLSFNSQVKFSNVQFTDRSDFSSDLTKLEQDKRFKTNLSNLAYNNGTWEIKENGLYSDATDKGDAFLVSEVKGTNFVYQTDVKFDSDKGCAALVFRSNNDLSTKESYAVNVNAENGNVKFWRWQANAANQLIAEKSVEKTDTYTLKVVAYNEWILYYVNDQLVASLGDYTLQKDDLGQTTVLTTGYFGLLNYNSKVTFQNTYYKEFDKNFNPLLSNITVETDKGTRAITDSSQFRSTEPMLLQYVEHEVESVKLNCTGNDSVIIKDENGNQYTTNVSIPIKDGINYLTVISTAEKDGMSASVVYRINVHRYKADEIYYNETYRDQYHYSVKEGWANDPNGLVYYNGVYHMFYQFYDDTVWGPMHWAHATSTDLIHWTDQPIALYPDANGAMFSGCIVVDENNSSGLFEDNTGGLIAFITADGNGQRIKIATSKDGYTWTKKDIVVADWVNDPLNTPDFRDPKVFKYENKWFMVVAGGPLRIYSSDNLVNWKCESTYADLHTECPDLYPIQYNGTTKWVLSRGGRYYKIGDFKEVDGSWKFVPDPAYQNSDGIMNFGNDSYAAMTYYVKDFGTASNPTIPTLIEVNWMNTWADGFCNAVADTVGQNFNGTFNLNLQLGLTMDSNENYVLTQTPIEEYNTLRDTEKVTDLKDVTINESNDLFKNFNESSYEIVAHFVPGENTSEVGFNVRTGNGEKTVVKYNLNNQTLTIDRSQSGTIIKSSLNVMNQSNVTRNSDGSIDLHIYVDRASVEVFTGNYSVAGAAQIFPSATSNGLEVYSLGQESKADITIYPLKTIWTDKVTPTTPLEIGLSQTSVQLYTGDTAQINAWLTPIDVESEISVESSDSNIVDASVSEGVITINAKSRGEATVTVKAGDLAKEISVKVTENNFKTNIKDLKNICGNWWIDDEELMVSNTGSNDYYLSQSPLTSDEYTMDFDIKYDRGLVNVFVATPNGTNPLENGGAYSVQFTNDSHVRLFAFGGNDYATGTLSQAINDNVYHHVKVQKTSSQILVFVDDEKVIDHTFDTTMNFFNENPYVGLGLWDGNVSFKNFVVKDANWNTLTELVEETIVEDNYTTNSVKVYKEAVENAKQALEDLTTSKETIEEHISLVTEAKKTLVDVVTLKDEMNISLNKEDYTKESWNQLEEAILKAEASLESGTQEEVNSCVEQLQSAKQNLVNVVELKNVMDISSLNKEDYTEESWNRLEEAVSKAEVCLESGTQEDVDACVSEIQSAKDGLVIKEKQESIIVKIIKVIVNWIKKLFPW